LTPLVPCFTCFGQVLAKCPFFPHLKQAPIHGDKYPNSNDQMSHPYLYRSFISNCAKISSQTWPYESDELGLQFIAVDLSIIHKECCWFSCGILGREKETKENDGTMKPTHEYSLVHMEKTLCKMDVLAIKQTAIEILESYTNAQSGTCTPFPSALRRIGSFSRYGGIYKMWVSLKQLSHIGNLRELMFQNFQHINCLKLLKTASSYTDSKLQQLSIQKQFVSIQFKYQIFKIYFKDLVNKYLLILHMVLLKNLYSHKSCLMIINDIFHQILLKNVTNFNFSDNWKILMEKESPSTMLWTLFYLVQHYDRRGQYDIALAKIDEAIEHTPTVIDLYSVKGRILKHAGDLVAAAALADEVRCMDLADRYVNSECVKRMLEADRVSLAEKTAVLFTKDGDQHKNLHDMQCMWYELASGESYFRQGDLGRALKKFLFVEKHYADINEDQSDFHSYCLRKMTLRTYVEMLKFQDRLHSHDYFRKAAAGAIR
ncbi:N-terminal acetyltransferase A complex auxiliary subunit NAA15, partial [Camellia lanceoleosa]